MGTTRTKALFIGNFLLLDSRIKPPSHKVNTIIRLYNIFKIIPNDNSLDEKIKIPED